jgi:hypothetical protein
VTAPRLANVILGQSEAFRVALAPVDKRELRVSRRRSVRRGFGLRAVGVSSVGVVGVVTMPG